ARQIFERRLTMIMRGQVSCRVPWVAAAAIGLFALVMLPGWSLGPGTGDARAETDPGGAPKRSAGRDLSLRIAVERLAAVEQERTRVRLAQKKVEAELAVLKDQEKAVADAAFPEALIQEHLQKDPVALELMATVAQLEARVEQIKRVAVNP